MRRDGKRHKRDKSSKKERGESAGILWRQTRASGGRNVHTAQALQAHVPMHCQHFHFSILSTLDT